MSRDVTIPIQYECHLVLVGIGICISISTLFPISEMELKNFEKSITNSDCSTTKILIKVYTEPLLSRNGLSLTKNETKQF